ncbi:MAG: sarcinarray family MAST domain-containing protein [Methanosarcinaceae archaeon]|nr:sarcinarray family MAST domain-containing protein [Methanosarcinaceae archaeon]
MKMKIVYFFALMILFSSNIAIAECPYGSMDVYYNDKILLGKDLAKPILKIGEPFSVKINLTVHQKSDVFVSLSCMERNSFEIIKGPTSKIEDYSKGDILETNSFKEYEWIVIPTERWKGGSLPLDIYYTILAHGGTEPLVESGFTIAYCTISNEYYKGKVPSPDTSPSESLPDSNSTSSESIPAFTLLAAVFAITLISFRH